MDAKTFNANALKVETPGTLLRLISAVDPFIFCCVFVNGHSPHIFYTCVTCYMSLHESTEQRTVLVLYNFFSRNNSFGVVCFMLNSIYTLKSSFKGLNCVKTRTP